MSNRHFKSLSSTVRRGQPLIVAGVGSGLTGRGAVLGGADVLAVYNTAVYRIQGLPTGLAFLPYDNANELAFRTRPEVIAVASDVPVLVGLGAHDPRFPIDALLDRIALFGAAGVTNEPFLGVYGDDFKAQLDAAGIGFVREVVLIRRAVERGMLTLGWAFTPDEARATTEAGAHFVGAMIGVTAGGPAGGTPTTSLDAAPHRGAWLCHGIHRRAHFHGTRCGGGDCRFQCPGATIQRHCGEQWAMLCPRSHQLHAELPSHGSGSLLCHIL